MTPGVLLLTLSAFAAAQTQTLLDTPALEAQRSVVIPLSTPEIAGYEPCVYALTINGRPAGDALLRCPATGVWLLQQADWARLGLKVPDDRTTIIGGQAFWPLIGVDGITVTEQVSEQRLILQVAASRFVASTRKVRPNVLRTPQVAAETGVLANYRLVGDWLEADGGHDTRLLGDTELRIFGPWGSASSQWFVDQLDSGGKLRRLDSFYRLDDPSRMTQLQIGDNFGAGGLWGRPQRFGGIRYARNFGTQPNFITVPQARFSGSSALPSVVDVLVDGQRRSSVAVPPGEFSLEQIPVVNPDGDITVVVRDVLGQQQTITSPYTFDARQLAPGLSDFSLEFGYPRENLGTASDDYGEPEAIAQYRYGQGEQYTQEFRAELAQARQTLGYGGVLGVNGLGIVSAALVASHASEASEALGGLITLGWQDRWGALRHGHQWSYASRGFQQSGARVPLKLATAHNLGFRINRQFGLGATWIKRTGYDDSRSELISLNSSGRLGRYGANLIATQSILPSRTFNVSLFFSIPWGQKRSASLQASHSETTSGSQQRVGGRIQQSRGTGIGTGWRLGASADPAQTDSTRLDGEYRLNRQHFGSLARATLTSDSQFLSLTGEGSVGYFQGRGFASRPVQDALAWLAVGAAAVPIELDGRPMGDTNAQGYLLLPDLKGYQANRIRLDLGDVPMDMQPAQAAAEVVPGHRAGLGVSLAGKPLRRLQLQLRYPSGGWPQAGTVLQLHGAAIAEPGQRSIVGRAGLVYLEGSSSGEVILELPECRAVLRWPEQNVTDLGALLCQPKAKAKAKLPARSAEPSPKAAIIPINTTKPVDTAIQVQWRGTRPDGVRYQWAQAPQPQPLPQDDRIPWSANSAQDAELTVFWGQQACSLRKAKAGQVLLCGDPQPAVHSRHTNSR